MIVDGHLDIAMALLSEPARDFGQLPPPGRAVSLPGLERAGVGLALATIFAPAGWWKGERPARAARRQLKCYEELLFRFQERLFRVESRGDLPLCQAGGPIGLVHAMEGADPLDDVDDLADWAEEGVRFLSLTWNHTNRYAGGTQGEGGLTADGRALLSAMEEVGVVPDLSHLNARSLDDLLATWEGPVVATHCNAAAVHPHPRNLSDAHLRAIGARGGIVGIALYGPFLTSGPASLDDVARHVEHIAQVAGVAHVGLGTDLDGGFTTDMAPDGIGTVADLPRIGGVLRQRGWAEGDVAAVLGRNWLRVVEQALVP